MKQLLAIGAAFLATIAYILVFVDIADGAPNTLGFVFVVIGYLAVAPFWFGTYVGVLRLLGDKP